MESEETETTSPPRSRSELTDRLVSVGTALQRLYYLQLLVSLVVLYLVIEIIGFNPFASEEGGSVRLAAEEQLKILEPLLELNDALRKAPEVIADYTEFVAPFLAIESAAVTAIVGADVSSEEWKALDPLDLDRARAINQSLTGLSLQLDYYSNDDYRELPVVNLIDFARLFVHPEPLDHASLVRNWGAGLRVAAGLGHSVQEPPAPWPDAVDFPHYLLNVRNDTELSQLIATAPSMERIGDAVIALEQFASQNGINNPQNSPRGLLAFLASGEQNLESLEGGDKVEITFIPTKIERMLLLIASPVVLMFLSHLFLGQYRRRRSLLVQLHNATSNYDSALVEYPWLLTNIDLCATSVAGNRTVLRGLFAIGLVLPLLCQGSIAAFAWTRFVPGVGRWFVIALTLFCFALSFAVAWYVVLDRARAPSWGKLALGSRLQSRPEQSTTTRLPDGGGRAADSTRPRYVGTRSGQCFHRPTCPSVEDHSDLLAWSSRRGAGQGRRACRMCKP